MEIGCSLYVFIMPRGKTNLLRVIVSYEAMEKTALEEVILNRNMCSYGEIVSVVLDLIAAVVIVLPSPVTVVAINIYFIDVKPAVSNKFC